MQPSGRAAEWRNKVDGHEGKIDKDMVAAQKAGDKLKLNVTRMLKSEIKYKEIEKKDQLDEAGLMDVLSSAAKRRRESIEGFSKGNRPDLVEKEKQELKIIQQYLPEQMTSMEVSQLIDEIISEVGALGASDKGRVMKVLMPKIKGKFDGKEAGFLVASRLKQKPSQGGELP